MPKDAMARHPQLQRFVDDELERAPLLIDEVMHLALDASRTRRADEPALDARLAFDLQAALQSRRDQMIRSFTASLKEQVDAAPDAASGSAGARPLSLLDESAVETDVEISHTVDLIASVAEYELRELGAYTSALVGDVYVAQHTNPFHAVVYARALWAAANVLPASKGLPLRFMRHAARPLAQALRKAYAAACSRLDEAGVVPGKHRTIVLHAGTRTVAPADEPSAPVDLPQLRDSMPVPLDGPIAAPSASAAPAKAPIEDLLRRASERLRSLPKEADSATIAQAIDLQRMNLLNNASTRAEQQVIELMARLFDTMLASRTLEPAAKQLLTAVHAPALSVALNDSRLLEAYDHPVWRFIDRIAFTAALYPRADDPLRAKLLHFVGGLVDSIGREPKPEAALFRWGLERLAALERHLFEQRLLDAAAHVAALQAQEAADREAHGRGNFADAFALDISTLETVPAALLDGSASDDAPPIAAADDWPSAHRPGQWVLVFLQRDWRVAQLLWRSESAQLWLYAEASDLPTWALRRRALDRLRSERLLHVMQPRSLVRKAADSVLRQIGPGR
jgi:Protein of unknown function (DUF1631)